MMRNERYMMPMVQVNFVHIISILERRKKDTPSHGEEVIPGIQLPQSDRWSQRNVAIPPFTGTWWWIGDSFSHHSTAETTWDLVKRLGTSGIYLSLEAYSCSILHRWSMKWPYRSRKSIPFCVWAAIQSYWSWNRKEFPLWWADLQKNFQGYRCLCAARRWKRRKNSLLLAWTPYGWQTHWPLAQAR